MAKLAQQLPEDVRKRLESILSKAELLKQDCDIDVAIDMVKELVAEIEILKGESDGNQRERSQS